MRKQHAVRFYERKRWRVQTSSEVRRGGENCRDDREAEPEPRQQHETVSRPRWPMSSRPAARFPGSSRITRRVHLLPLFELVPFAAAPACVGDRGGRRFPRRRRREARWPDMAPLPPFVRARGTLPTLGHARSVQRPAKGRAGSSSLPRRSQPRSGPGDSREAPLCFGIPGTRLRSSEGGLAVREQQQKSKRCCLLTNKRAYTLPTKTRIASQLVEPKNAVS